MRKTVLIFTLLLGTLTFLFIIGCGGSKQEVTPDKNKGSILNLPDWFVDPPKDPGYLFATANATSPDLRVAISSAEQRGRGSIALQLEQRTDALVKDFLEQAGVGEDADVVGQFKEVSKSVASQIMNLLRRKKLEPRQKGTLYETYVLMELPIGDEKAALLQNIKKDRHLYDRFRANQAFQELEEEVEKLQEFKKQQQQGMQ